MDFSDLVAEMRLVIWAFAFMPAVIAIAGNGKAVLSICLYNVVLMVQPWLLPSWEKWIPWWVFALAWLALLVWSIVGEKHELKLSDRIALFNKGVTNRPKSALQLEREKDWAEEQAKKKAHRQAQGKGVNPTGTETIKTARQRLAGTLKRLVEKRQEESDHH